MLLGNIPLQKVEGGEVIVLECSLGQLVDLLRDMTLMLIDLGEELINRLITRCRIADRP